MRLLDLFCGEGGAAAGYIAAGFEVTGVDRLPLAERYPGSFIQGDVLELDPDWVASFDAIHASPPCQAHSKASNGAPRHRFRPRIDLIPQTRELLEGTGLPYVIENVEGAPLEGAVTLCGSSFGLGVRRHRLFETNWPLEGLPCRHEAQGPTVPVYGNGGRDFTLASGSAAMGIDWMTRRGLTQAIPPAYTAWIGDQLALHLDGAGTVVA